MEAEKRTPESNTDADEQWVLLNAREAELLHAAAPDLAAKRPAADPAPGQLHKRVELHICPDCGAGLVQPTRWSPAPGNCWSVELRCPDCEWIGDGVYSQDAVDRFDIVLDDGCQAILDDLTKLTHANMADQIDRFAAALAADLILPEDF